MPNRNICTQEWVSLPKYIGIQKYDEQAVKMVGFTLAEYPFLILILFFEQKVAVTAAAAGRGDLE